MSLAAWARPKETSSLAPALSRLERLPAARHGVTPPAPLVVGSKDDYHAACARVGHPGHLSEEIARAPIVDVPLRGIHTIQRSVNPDRVAQYLRDPGLTPPDAVGKHGGPVGVPIIVRAEGVLHAHDGHHRLSAAALRGETKIRARFVDLDRR